MNTNALYTELKKNLEVKKTNFKQGNIIDKIKKTIMDLNINLESMHILVILLLVTINLFLKEYRVN